MKWIVGCGMLAALGGIGCGRGALPSDEVTLPDALTCGRTSWNVVRTLTVGSSVPSNLAMRDGVFYVSIASMGIVALPPDGSDPVVLTTELASRLWVEGDFIYFGKNDDRLRRLPLAGGTPEMIVDGMTSHVAPGYSSPSDTALDASYYYWDLSPQTGAASYALWRAPRAGGAAEKLADLPPRDPVYSWPRLTPTSDTVLVALATQNVAYAVSLTGGGMRMLPQPPPPSRGTSNMLVGSSPAGVLWMNEAWDSGEQLYPSVHLSIADSDPNATAARPFWSGKPPFLRPIPMASWPDGRGGWLIGGTETFADGSRHTSLWDVDASGTIGTRLGCGPEAASGSVWSTVVTPDSVYAIVSFDDYTAAGYQWLLVRMDRAPATPTGA